MAVKVFIDGQAGTTGLRIHERLADRKDLTMITPDRGNPERPGGKTCRHSGKRRDIPVPAG